MTKRFAGDDQAVQVYTAAVEAIAARYPGTPELFTAPRWREAEAEAAINRAFARRDTEAFVAAVQHFEAVALDVLTAIAADARCDHVADPELRAWRAENSAMRCARCFVDAGHGTIHPGDGPALFHFGKYRGREVTAVAAEDPDYCRWALGKGLLKGRTRRAAEAALRIVP